MLLLNNHFNKFIKMELMLNKYNQEHLDLIRDNIVKHYITEHIHISKYDICSKDDMFIYKISGEHLSSDQKSHIKAMFNELKNSYKVLYKGSYFPIKQLKILNSGFNKVQHFVDIYYYEEGKIDHKLIEFAKHFLEIINGNYSELTDIKKYENLLNIDRIGLCKFDRIENFDNSLHFEIDNEIHSSKYNDMAQIIYERMKSSNIETHCNVTDIDIQNISRIKKGTSPIVFMNHHDFKSVIAFCNISMGLPTMNLHSIKRFIKGFNKEYYNLKFLESYISEYQKIETSYYFNRVFETELEAKCFGIYLGSEGVKFLVHNNSVYYENISEIEPLDLEDVKNIICVIYSKISGINIEEFNKFDLKSLLNVYNHDGHLISFKHDINHTNPYNGKLLDLDYYDRKNNTFMGIFPEFNLKGIYDTHTRYNNHNLKDLPYYDIKISEGSIYFNNKLVKSNFFISDIHRFRYNVDKLWKKGYFLNTFGLMNYIYNDELLEQCIELPEWFTLKNSSEENLFRFMENIILNH